MKKQYELSEDAVKVIVEMCDITLKEKGLQAKAAVDLVLQELRPLPPAAPEVKKESER